MKGAGKDVLLLLVVAVVAVVDFVLFALALTIFLPPILHPRHSGCALVLSERRVFLCNSRAPL